METKKSKMIKGISSEKLKNSVVTQFNLKESDITTVFVWHNLQHIIILKTETSVKIWAEIRRFVTSKFFNQFNITVRADY